MDNYTREEDWTFATADTRYMTHGFHLYPARMIPQIARRLIEMFIKSREDIILDPFCGSGSVLVESMLKGNNSIGVDINPLAVLIAKVKTTPISHEVLTKTAQDIFFKKREQNNTEFNIPNIRNLEYWFKPEVIRDLTILKEHICELEDVNTDIHNFFRVCFSLTVRKTSNVKGREYKLYRIHPEELKLYRPDAFKIFREIVKANINKMRSFYEELKNKPKAKAYTLLGDTRNLLNIKPEILSEETVNLVVTSPPYGDSHTTVAYGQFSRYPALWLGFDEKIVMEIDDVGLGGRVLKEEAKLESQTLTETLDSIKEKDEYRAKEVLAFFYDTDKCLKQISKALIKGKSHCCFVLANRTVKRVKVLTDQILVELGTKYGLKCIETKYRDIPLKRIPWEIAPENIPGQKGFTMNKESIIIWKY